MMILQVIVYKLSYLIYRYQGKSKALMYDVTKIISALKTKRGDHRVFRLAENLCMNLILSLRDFFFVKREGKVNYFRYASFFFFLLSRYSFIKLNLNYICCNSGRVQLNSQKLWIEQLWSLLLSSLRQEELLMLIICIIFKPC